MDKNKKIIDLFNGKKDIERKTIKAVGKPKKRFSEDALRMLRAIRFAVELPARGGPAFGWNIEKETFKAN